MHREADEAAQEHRKRNAEHAVECDTRGEIVQCKDEI